MNQDLLRQVRLFVDLDEDELERLAALFTEEVLPAGHRVFKPGDPSDAFYVVHQGGIALYSDQPGKPIHLHGRLSRGDFFGELGLFDGFERAASARASETSRVLRIPKDALLTFLDDHPAIAIKMQIAAARRHSQNVSLALDLGHRSEVRIRLGKRAEMILEDGIRLGVVVENLSLGGICLRDVPETWQRHWTLRFELLYDGERLPVIGRITWRRGDTVGLAFSRTDPEHDDRVQRMLRRLLDHGPRPAAASVGEAGTVGDTDD